MTMMTSISPPPSRISMASAVNQALCSLSRTQVEEQQQVELLVLVLLNTADSTPSASPSAGTGRLMIRAILEMRLLLLSSHNALSL
jgi:invasion protein IalB